MISGSELEQSQLKDTNRSNAVTVAGLTGDDDRFRGVVGSGTASDKASALLFRNPSIIEAMLRGERAKVLGGPGRLGKDYRRVEVVPGTLGRRCPIQHQTLNGRTG